MKRLFFTLFFALFLCNLSMAQSPVIDPELELLLKEKGDEMVSVNIILKAQMKTAVLEAGTSKLADKASKREFVVTELKNFSEINQRDVMAVLRAEENGRNVQGITSHWIANSINCMASADVIYRLAEHPDIKAIVYNKMEKIIRDEKGVKVNPSRGMTENITQVNANDVWGLGTTGEGVIVAVIDTGVNYDHVDLKDHLWDGGSDYPYHGWDFINNDNNPMDDHSHGTHCAGTICGDGTSGTQTGMAPDATLMCLKVFGSDGGTTFDAVQSSVEFAIDHGADVLSCSFGSTYPNAYISELYREVFTNVLYAGVVAAVSAGNERDQINSYPIPRNVGSPGNCPPPWIHPDQQANAGGLSSVVCVGAVDYDDAPAYFSSEGPVTWQYTYYGDYAYSNGDIIFDENWLYYDNGNFHTSIGVGSGYSFYWGVKFSSEVLQSYAGKYLTEVSMYDYSAHTGSILIYQGGDNAPGTLVHTQSYTGTGSAQFVNYDLTTPITIDTIQNLWIIMLNDIGDVEHPAPASEFTGNADGSWCSIDGINWYDIAEPTMLGEPLTWMIRAYVTDEFKGEVAELQPITDYEYTASTGKLMASNTNNDTKDNSTSFGLIRPDVSAPGVDILSCAYDDNDGFYTMSGTSMAAPCTAGVMALMLSRNPSLTPADICRLLETTAVPLSATKSNRTGSGRIDAFAAIQEIAPCANIVVDSYSPDVIYTEDNETINIVFRNIGDVALAGNTNVSLTCDDEYVTIIDGDATIDAMASGATATAQFVVKADETTPDEHIVNFKIIAENDGNTFNNSISVQVSNEIIVPLPMVENFDSPSMPLGWRLSTVGKDNWSISSSSHTGGSPNELHFIWTPQFDGISRVITPYMDMSDIVTIEVSFRHYLYNFEGSSTIGIATSSDKGATWNSIWYESYSEDGEYVVDEILASPDFGNDKVLMCLYFQGNSYNIDNWYFDDITVKNSGAPVQGGSYSFETGSDGWTTINANGDDHTWYHNSAVGDHGTNSIESHTGTGYMMNESYCNATSTPMEPDDYLVSPVKYLIEEGKVLSFWACAQDANYAAEHFGVAVSTEGNTDASDFTTIAEWTIGSKGDRSRPRNTRDNTPWQQYTVDLSAYAGQQIWLAIRHFDCNDQFILLLDDVTIDEGQSILKTVDVYAVTSPFEGGYVSGEGIYEVGSTVTLTATSNTGYKFKNWTRNGVIVSDEPSFSFKVTEDYEITDYDFDNGYIDDIWYNDVNYPWVITDNAYDGYAIKSSCEGVDNGSSSIEIIVNVPYDCNMSFYHKLTSEQNYDKAYFYIDGVEQFVISGTHQWQLMEFSVDEGTHTYKWSYIKDSSVNTSEDAYFIDNISLYHKNTAPYTEGWMCYDDDIFETGIGGPQSFYWGVKYPVESLINLDNTYLTMVSMYDCAVNTGGYIYIYQGGENTPETLVHTQPYEGTGCNRFVRYDLTSAIPIDITQPLWIVMGTVMGEVYPASSCNDTGDPNGRWISLDGNTWEDLINHDLNYTWMLRGYVTDDVRGDVSDLKPLDVQYNVGYGEFNVSEDAATRSIEADDRSSADGSIVYIANFEIVNHQRYLTSGWNWYSTYININGTQGFANLTDAIGYYGIQIKSQKEFATHEYGYWFGSLTSTSVNEMYKIQMEEPYYLDMFGDEVSGHETPIILEKNWKWIGYPIKEELSLTTAFADINPSDGDFIKSQYGFSQYYSSTGWTGELNKLEPGKGYMYYNASGMEKTLYYPYPDMKEELKDNVSNDNNYWKPNVSKYADNMSIIAVVKVDSDTEINTDYEIGAFCDGECRGSARPIYVEALDRYMIFMTVYGEGDEEITFRYFDTKSNSEYRTEAVNKAVFSVDGILGTIVEPFVLKFGMVDIDEHSENTFDIYPNPADMNNVISLGTNCEYVEVYNSIGVKVAEYKNVETIKGLSVSGAYILKLTNNNEVRYCKLVVK